MATSSIENGGDQKLTEPESIAGIAKPQRGAWHRLLNFFLYGPYFKVVPPQGLVNTEEFEKDLARVLSDDKAEDYAVPPAGLMILPFDTPVFYEYIQDIFLGTFTVTQYILVMFIIMMVENEQRAACEPRAWISLVRALLILYPAITMIMLILMTSEYTFRRFMYYRLLSLQILVDWDNMEMWQSWFFWYFVSTWVMINVWALYGVIRYWGTDAPNQPDSVSFATWGIVNLQTIQLLVYYMRLQSAELRLVTLNKFIERAPVEAQKLIDYTYVVKEVVLQEECYRFLDSARACWRRRTAFMVTFGYLGQDWQEYKKDAWFDLGFLVDKAVNRVAVLRAERAILSPKGDASGVDESAVEVEMQPAGKDWDAQGMQRSATGDSPRLPRRGHFQSGRLKGPRYGEADQSLLKRLEAMVDWLPKALFKGLYASSQGMYISFLPGVRSWPFRDDVKYFRFMIICEIFCLCAVAGMLAYGITAAVSSTCKTGWSNCRNCEANYDKYVLREQQCSPADSKQVTVLLKTINTLSHAAWRALQDSPRSTRAQMSNCSMLYLANSTRTLANVTLNIITNSAAAANDATLDLLAATGISSFLNESLCSSVDVQNNC